MIVMQMLFCVAGLLMGECRWESVASFNTMRECEQSHMTHSVPVYGVRCIPVARSYDK